MSQKSENESHDKPSQPKEKTIEELTDDALERARSTLIGYVFDFHVDEIPPDPIDEKAIELPSTSKKSSPPKLLRVTEMLDRKPKTEVIDDDDALFEKEDAKIKPKTFGRRSTRFESREVKRDTKPTSKLLKNVKKFEE